MRVWAYFTLEVKDKNGRLVKRIRRRSRSYVIGFLDFLAVHWRNTSGSITDTGGTSRTVGGAYVYACNGAYQDDTYGPVVGTGTTAVAVTDTKLVTQIAQGTGAGQLDHQATTTTAPATSGSTRSFTVRRVLVNASGGTITIQECGVYAKELTNSWKFCLVRDLVSGGQAVPNGGSATLTYTIGVTA